MVSEKLLSLGFLLLIISIAIIMISFFFNVTNKSSIKGGIVGFIGPIPMFGIASDKKMLYILLGLAVALFILASFLKNLK